MPTLYRYNILKKELRLDFRDQKNGRLKLPTLGIFAALLALAVHFILQTMTDTVLTEAIPEFMARTNFSLISTYNIIFFVSLAVDKVIHFRTKTFAETQKNYWYLQAKMGYKPSLLVLSKITARLFVTTTSYIIGFSTILALGFLLKYNFISSYIITLFCSGLADSLVLLLMILTISLLVQDSSNNVLSVCLVAIGHLVAKHASGRYDLISQPGFMRDFYRFFDVADSPYLIYQFAISLTCLFFVIVSARYSAFYFHYSREKVNQTPAAFTVCRIQKTKLRKKKDKDSVIARIERGDYTYPIIPIPNPGIRAQRMAKFTNGVFTMLATLVIVMMLIFNVFVLLISAAQKTSEVSISGTIPYLFHSETMDPAIAKNDLVYFQQIDLQSHLNVGDIVILKDNYEIFIERVVAIEDNQITVDIDNYPAPARQDAMLKTVKREAIYGRYSRRNRWLGALIHFANTIIGRILFLLVPSILLFYHDKVLKLLERFYYKSEDQEAIASQRALHEKRQLERLEEQRNA